MNDYYSNIVKNRAAFDFMLTDGIFLSVLLDIPVSGPELSSPDHLAFMSEGKTEKYKFYYPRPLGLMNLRPPRSPDIGIRRLSKG